MKKKNNKTAEIITNDEKRVLSFPEGTAGIDGESMDEASRKIVDIRQSRESACSHSIGEVIKKYRKAEGLSQGELAEEMGVHKNTVFSWENNVQAPSLEKAIELCLLLHMPIQELTGVYEGDDISSKVTPQMDNLINYYDQLSDNYQTMLVSIAGMMAQQQYEERMKMLKDGFRLFDWYDTPLSAGPGSEFGDTPVGYCFAKANPKFQKADAIFRVSGHSMEDKYFDGDYVYAQYADDAEDGQDVVCESTSKGAVIKHKKGNRLVSLNPDYPFDGTEDDHIRIVAVVLGVADKSDLADKSLYPDLEEVHAKEIRKFNREHRIRE